MAFNFRGRLRQAKKLPTKMQLPITGPTGELLWKREKKTSWEKVRLYMNQLIGGQYSLLPFLNINVD
jgi:hypothetical protein